MSPILVTLTSRSDSNLEPSNISLKETKPDGVDSNSNGPDYCVRNNEGKIRWFLADRSGETRLRSKIVLLFNTDIKEPCVPKYEGLPRSKILGILQTETNLYYVRD